MKIDKYFLPSLINVREIPRVNRRKSIAQESFQLEPTNSDLESEADLFGATIPDVKFRGTVLKSVQLRYTKQVKYITLLRYLTGKIAFDEKRVERIDLLLLFDTLVTLQQM